MCQVVRTPLAVLAPSGQTVHCPASELVSAISVGGRMAVTPRPNVSQPHSDRRCGRAAVRQRLAPQPGLGRTQDASVMCWRLGGGRRRDGHRLDGASNFVVESRYRRGAAGHPLSIRLVRHSVQVGSQLEQLKIGMLHAVFNASLCSAGAVSDTSRQLRRLRRESHGFDVDGDWPLTAAKSRHTPPAVVAPVRCTRRSVNALRPPGHFRRAQTSATPGVA